MDKCLLLLTVSQHGQYARKLLYQRGTYRHYQTAHAEDFDHFARQLLLNKLIKVILLDSCGRKMKGLVDALQKQQSVAVSQSEEY